MRRAAIYARQSKTAEGSESLQDQVERCQEAATRLDLEVVAILVEPPSTSAFKDRGRSRPRWKDLLELIRTKQIECVLVYKTDRLGRGGGPGYAPFWDVADKAKLDPDRLVFTPSGSVSEFELGIRASMDREESKKLQSRMLDARSREAKAGKPRPGGRRPFGYEADCVTVIPEERDAIRDAAQRFVAGESLWSIAGDWNASGPSTVTGKPWSSHVLRQVISSPRAAGMRQHRDTVVAKDCWPAILDNDLYEAVQARLAGHRRVAGGSARTSYLAGLLRCAVCGKDLRSVRTSEKARAYACRPGPGLGGCGKIKLAAERVERLVKEVVIGTLIDPVNLQRLMDIGATTETDKNGPSKADRISVAQAKLDRLKDLYVDGEITRPDYDQRKAIIEDEITAIVSDDPKRRALSDLPSSAAEFETRWEDGGLPLRQSLTRLVVTRIVVSPTSKRGPGLDTDRLAWIFV